LSCHPVETLAVLLGPLQAAIAAFCDRIHGAHHGALQCRAASERDPRALPRGRKRRQYGLGNALDRSDRALYFALRRTAAARRSAARRVGGGSSRSRASVDGFRACRPGEYERRASETALPV